MEKNIKYSITGKESEEKTPNPLEIYLETPIDNPVYKHNELMNNGFNQILNEESIIQRWKYLAYLMFCNGGNYIVKNYGNTGYDPNFPYKAGLTFEEYMITHGFASIITACSWYEKDKFQLHYMPKINNYIAEKRKLWEDNLQVEMLKKHKAWFETQKNIN